MAAIVITPAAEKDLVNIWLYIARDNSEAADCVYQAAENTFYKGLCEYWGSALMFRIYTFLYQQCCNMCGGDV